MKPTISATITQHHVEFRGFTDAVCDSFDPCDDYMFFPMTLGYDDGIDLEFILLRDDGTELVDDHYNSYYYGLRWSLQKWDARTGRKIAWKLIEDMRERLEDDASVIYLR